VRWPAPVALLLAITAVGCGGGSEPAPDAELTVFVSVPIEGPLAADGGEVAAGAKQALADAGGEAGGVPVDLQVLEATNTASGFAANARRADEDSTSIAYIGELDPVATLSSVPITNDARMLQVSPTAYDPELVAPFEGSDEVPEETQSTGQRTFGTLARLGGSARELGEEAMAVVLDSIARADDPLDRASVSRAFLATSGRESPLGTYSVDELGVARPD
jgi:hypothetical protein